MYNERVVKSVAQTRWFHEFEPRSVFLLFFVAVGCVIDFGTFLQIFVLLIALTNIFTPQGRLSVVVSAPLFSGVGFEGFSPVEFGIPLLLVLCLLQAYLDKTTSENRFPKMVLFWGILAAYVLTVSLAISLSNGIEPVVWLSDGISYVNPFLGLFVLSKDSPHLTPKNRIFLAFYFITLATYLYVSNWAAIRGFLDLRVDVGKSNRGIDAAYLVLLALTYQFKRMSVRVLTLCLSVYGLLLSGSRGSWMIVATAAVISLFFMNREQVYKSTFSLLAPVGLTAFLISAGFVASTIVSGVAIRFQQLVNVLQYGRQSDASGIQRSQATAQVLNDWYTSPLFGNGPGHAYSWIIWDPGFRQIVSSSYQVDSPFAPLGELGLFGYTVLTICMVFSLYSLIRFAQINGKTPIAVSTSVALALTTVFFGSPVDFKSFTSLLVVLFLICDSTHPSGFRAKVDSPKVAVLVKRIPGSRHVIH